MSNKSEGSSQFNQKLMDGQEIEKYVGKLIQKDIFYSEIQIQGCASFQTPQIDTKREIKTEPELKKNENPEQIEQMAMKIQIPKISNSNQNFSPTQPNHDQLQFKEILSEKMINMPKNSNVIRYFNKFYIRRCTWQKYMRFFQGQPVILRQVKKFIQQQKRMYKKMRKNWNHNIDSMIKIFGLVEGSSNPAQRSLIMRKIAHQMIYQEMIPAVLKSKKIGKKMKKCYIYTMRILSRRCSNNLLMTRTQI